MKGIQFLLFIFIAVLTSANPTAYDEAVPDSSVNDKILVEEIPPKSEFSIGALFPRPSDCGEVRLSGNNKSGVYYIWPKSRRTPCKAVKVYCDMKVDGGGWTVLQRRGQYGNAQNFFNKTWEFYKQGFGDLKKEFWIGNEVIYALTNQGAYSVRFDMRLVNGKSAYAVYDKFSIEDEDRKYQVNIDGYSGDAGDSMAYHQGMKFSTWDNDNDNYGSRYNCAFLKTGGWWFNSCHYSHLNGMNMKGKYDDPSGHGIIWESFSGYQNSLEFTEIKIKQEYFN